VGETLMGAERKGMEDQGRRRTGKKGEKHLNGCPLKGKAYKTKGLFLALRDMGHWAVSDCKGILHPIWA
jgi:hypothetical protein